MSFIVFFIVSQFSLQYAGISETCMPVELPSNLNSQQLSILCHAQSLSSVFLMVIDTCVDEEELVTLNWSLQMSLSLLPRNALIGLITYGKMVQVNIYFYFAEIM